MSEKKGHLVCRSFFVGSFVLKAFLQNYFHKLYALFCGKLVPNSVVAAYYDVLIRDKFYPSCDAHPAVSIFQIRPDIIL